MLLLLDNYDSFTWNLYQALAALGAEVVVRRNDAATVDELLRLAPRAIVLSPGPGRPSRAGVQPSLLERLPERTPLLGVCLGHQGLVESAGGELEIDPIPVHGRSSWVVHERSRLLRDLPSPFKAGRYHSLRAKRDRLPASLRATAWTEQGHVMAVEHVELPRFGVQFHPESILTPLGDRVLARFLAIAEEVASSREPSTQR